MTPAIRLNGIVKAYTRGSQKIEVLHSLSLEIEQGEFVSIMGPSGSGKTTLLNLNRGARHRHCGGTRSCRNAYR